MRRHRSKEQQQQRSGSALVSSLVVILSATPFEYDYADLYRQLDVFGFGDTRFRDSDHHG